MRILVTGGAGFIGAHVVTQLRERGDQVIIADDLITGLPDRVGSDGLHVMALEDPAVIPALGEILRRESIDAVIHFAARKQVFESVERPAWYYQQNIGSLANVLLAMEEAGVKRLVFSSSASVYGTTEGSEIVETDATVPVNPYGDTKLIGEHMVAAAGRAWGLRGISLRYFNVAGAGSAELGDRAVLNLVPMIFERLDAGTAPLVFGDDYNTPDGSCVRDYVHVVDLADAHLATLDHLENFEDSRHEAYNVGTGTGTSVLEMVEAVRRASGLDFEAEIRPRRAGDPATVVASAEKIHRDMGWTASLGIDDIIGSAWAAHRANSASS